MTATDTAHEAWDQTWRSREESEEWGTPIDDVLHCATRLRLQGARTALDLGCGVGRHALALAALGFETTALDASESGLAEVAANARTRDLAIETMPGRMTDLPFADASFDYVLSWNVIYHGDGEVVAKAIAEIARVLKPGGTYQGTMLSKRRHDYGRGIEISPNTFVQPDGSGDKQHPHFFCNAAELIALFDGFEARELRDVDPEDAGEWHWHLVAERV